MGTEVPEELFVPGYAVPVFVRCEAFVLFQASAGASVDFPDLKGVNSKRVKPSVITRSIPVAAAVYATVGGAMSLAGWIFDVPRFLDWAHTGIEIKANTSIIITLAGIALTVHLFRPRWRYLTSGLGLLVACVAGATLFEHISGRNLGIDTLLFDEPAGRAATTAPGRMGLPASTSLTILGAALCLITINKRTRFWASVLGALTLAIASLSLVGYLFGANQLYSIAVYTGIAFQTATMLAALGIGVSWAVPEQGLAGAIGRDDTGGLVFRRLIIPAILISLLLGWLRVWGQHAGFYDLEFGTAARTLAEIVLLLILLWRTTADISVAEAETRLLSRLPTENPNPVMRLASNGELLYANDAARQTGIDWTPGALDAVADGLRSDARNALAANAKTLVEIQVGERFFSCTIAPIGGSGYVNIYADDITERKRSEQLLSRRMQEMAALYRFTDRLHHSTQLADVYEAALDAITDALPCDRASILLFDSNGVMSFVASRGLSDEYRKAVHGHSPWTPETRDAQPLVITDIERSDVSDELKAVIKGEGITTLAFIPLASNAVLIGKFMIYCNDAHEFTEAELELALTIAHQIAFGVERRRVDDRRRKTEAALRENDTRLRLATRTGKVGVWDWDVQTNRVSWTESIYVMHGVDENGFDGTPEGFAALVYQDDRELVDGAIRSALAGETGYEVEFRVLRPDGQMRWLYTNATVLRDGEVPLRMIGATIDITERKLAELGLGKLAAIVESSTDAIVGKDMTSTITSWNRAAQEMFGYTADEAIGKSITMLIPDDRQDEETLILERIRRREPIEHYETIRRRKDGSLIELSLSISPIVDAEGKVVGASKIARDITGRRAAEAALRESEIMRTLVDAQESERHRIARDLHDHLGQQLTALRLKLESIRSKAVGSDDLLSEIDDTCSQAARIDADINFLSWELRPTELDKLGLRDALSSFVREWSVNYGIEAEFHAGGVHNGRLHPDIETNLYRIVQEGLNNVLKHSNAKKVCVLFENRDGDAVLIIEDDGIGFEPKLDAKRAKNGKNGKIGGLGLIGMRERTALLGGSLEIETTPGKGTSLFARVPVRGPED